LPLAVLPLLQYLSVASFGSRSFLSYQMLVLLPFMAALLVMLLAPFLLVVRRLRPFAVHSLIGAAVFAVATVAGLRLGGNIRTAAFRSLAARSVPLVQAIRAYEARHGAPPADLTALVPEFLPGVPGTRIGAYPRYGYHAGEEAASRYGGNPWVLVVFTPCGFLNFDTFMYFPLQNYPMTGYGGSLELIADWAYVHE
jgi:hypothetical protein